MSEQSATGDWPTRTDAVAAEWPALPGYEILEELGRGGMGVVYKARQTSANRLVALKLIRDGALASAQERARFRVEAEAAGRMQHPNIVHIFEAGEHQGQQFFAMELVEGGTLDKHLTGQPLPAAQAAELIRALALAVQHAHERNIVHRDLKPANILLQRSEIRSQRSEKTDATLSSDLCPLTSDLFPKVSDFGLAKRLDADSTAMTQTGAVLGTASYMAPEQAAGRTREIGPAVDVYALGAILYELLTGRRTFHAESWNETTSAGSQRRAGAADATSPRSAARSGDGVPEVPGKRARPALRQRRELADELSRFLEAKPVSAVPLGAVERLARLAARDGYQIVGEVGRGPRSIALSRARTARSSKPWP